MKLRSALLLAIALGISNAVAQGKQFMNETRKYSYNTFNSQLTISADLCRKHTIVAGDTVEILKSNYGYQGTLGKYSQLRV